MNAERRPVEVTEAASGDLAGELISSIVPQIPSCSEFSDANAPHPHLVGHTVERALDATLWRLVLGEVGLQDLTFALAGFYYVGHADGVASQATTIRQLRHDSDRYYSIAFNDKALAAKVTARMERIFIETIETEMLGGAR